MDYRIISENFVTVLIHKGESITVEEARQAVRHALTVCGYTPWQNMSLELFEGQDGDLLMASPEKEPEVFIADYALTFIEEYFTD